MADILFLDYAGAFRITDKGAVESRPDAEHEVEAEVRGQPQPVAFSSVKYWQYGLAIFFYFRPETYAAIDKGEKPFIVEPFRGETEAQK